MMDLEIGKRGESLAAEYLEARGYRVLERNYRFQRAEVDLICFEPADRPEDGGEIVFVEVKTRRSGRFGAPESAVDAAKQKNVLKAARSFLYEHRMERARCRFDVISVNLAGTSPVIDHFIGAFGA